MTVNTLFSNTLCVLSHGNLGDTSLRWFTLHVNLTLAQSTTANTSSDHYYALLSLVAKTASSVDSSWSIDTTVYFFTAPLDHAVLTLLMRLSCFWIVPCFTNMLVKTLNHCTSPTPYEHFADLPPLFEDRDAYLRPPMGD